VKANNVLLAVRGSAGASPSQRPDGISAGREGEAPAEPFTIARCAGVLALLFLLCIPALAAELVATRRAVVPGVEYIHERHTNGPYSIHIVKIDLDQPDLALVVNLANGVVLGRETVRRQVARVPRELGRPVAAVNGDYFEIGKTGDRRYVGNLEGAHIGNGELVHVPRGNVFWMDAAGRPHLTNGVRSRFSLTWPDGAQTGFGLNSSTTAHQTEVSAADVVLYTPTFGNSTRTDSGLELVLKPAPRSPWLPVRAGGCYTGIVQSVSRRGDTRIRPGTMVVSAVTNVAAKLTPIRRGDRIVFTTQLEPDLAGVPQAIGAGPILLLGGQPPARGLDRKNLAPRTVIGFNATHLFLVVVDGRQPRLSVGMSHGELADLMQRLGCTDALNMDGGGSSTLWLDGKVVNSPSDRTGERAVGNAVVIVRRENNVP